MQAASGVSDTQWPRYRVFLQERPDRPHFDAGTVHAPDPELALLNARDVFVRRPDCVSLWVAPADQILAMTAEAISANQWPVQPVDPPAAAQPYLVFVKRGPKGARLHAGEVLADSPLEAMRQAVALGPAPPTSDYWVVPKRSVLASEAEQATSFFGPARDKPYRNQAFYPTESMLREIRRRSDPEGEGA